MPPLTPKYCITIFLLETRCSVIVDAQVLQTFYMTWVWGVDYQKQLLGPKLTGLGEQRSVHKIWNPLFISAIIRASNFKFGIQHVFEE